MKGQEPATLQDLQRVTVEFSGVRDWNQFHNPKDLALSLVLEATEVLEHFQWKNGKELKAHIVKKRSEIGDEIADVMAYIFLLANALNLDLADAFLKKMKESEKKYPIAKAKGRSTKYTDL